ncbi:MAG: carboxypeptidase regulatory-like domain-containing protein [Bacteroidetes bacterium]|nr:carboxypeptidase regulatory-like domain-containing protein [Bacteroidota bacterium]
MNRLKLIAFLFLSLHYCYSQQITIHFKGKIFTEKNSAIGGANIHVVQDEFLSSSTQADVDGNYNLYLPLNREFDITVSKEGYVQKKYFVSTKGIKENQVMPKFPDYVADVVLFTRYEGVDYSLFDQPINKYSYNPKNNNIDYDEAYLKDMKAAMKEVQKAEQEVIKAAREKELADKKLAKQSKVGYIPQRKPAIASTSVQNSDKTIVISNTVVNKKALTPNVLALLAKYQPGVTEEIIQGKNVYIIQRILVKEEEVWIYQKKIFNWGGVACFRDNESITEGIFDQETSANLNPSFNTTVSSK